MAIPGEWRLRLARRYVRRGGVIAYPTEGVYGLGCDPLNELAVLRLLALKQRSWRQGLIVIGANLEQLWRFIGSDDPKLLERLQASWPGPTSWIVPASAQTPTLLTGGRATVALRVPAHAFARALCQACGPLVSTSAIPHGRPPARCSLAVRHMFGGAIDHIFPGALGDRNSPSVLRDGRTDRVFRR